ncbi:hypothetical protein WN71_034440 [Streptomyces mangrovisoli]|uniref:SGNH hydrolase-type esterase domain-containing protein n=1 Tax=Streptomyces mangrovisoli TaxID=1428628 RepID=A0A1J4NLT7_9ACTN|nr:hypothetical protein WN71_034440 [Streptomyces mangrovisoli]
MGGRARFLGALLVLPLLVFTGPTARAHEGGGAGEWTGTWETAPSGTAAARPGAAIRNVVRLSVGGTAVRVRLSNRFGTTPLTLAGVTVALQDPARPHSPAAAPGSQRAAAFKGARSVVVPPGKDLYTDPIPLAVPGGADLLVTVRTPAGPGSGPAATIHRDALTTTFIAPDGAPAAADGTGAAYTAAARSWYYVSGVDVRLAGGPGSVVAFGDSLTDGVGSTFGADHRWPDRLAALTRALPASQRPGVLNAGISGNRLLHDGVGPSAPERLDADALSRAGVRTLVVFEGVNDIKGSPEAADPAAYARAYRTLVARAHARGIRVVGATLTPFGGHPAYTAAREAVRQQVNALIRGGRIFDTVVDFDAVVRDPKRPSRILPGYDPGDHLHFDDAGMLALARAACPAVVGGQSAAARPHGTAARPHGTTSQPHGTTSQPHGTTSQPRSTAPQPHSTTSQPHSTAPSHAPVISRQVNSSVSTLQPPARIAVRSAAIASPWRPSRSRSER